MPTVLLSAPYMIPYVERFRPVFEHYGLELIVPEVHERLSRKNCWPMPGSLTAPSAATTATPCACWKPACRA